MTANSYNGIVFEGVCTNISNTVYDVETVQKAVEDSELPRRYENVGVHLGLTLIHRGWIDETESGYELSDGFDLGEVSEDLELRLEDGDVGEEEFASFVEFVESVIETLTREKPESRSQQRLRE